jgi:hypothetical protein
MELFTLINVLMERWRLSLVWTVVVPRWEVQGLSYLS